MGCNTSEIERAEYQRHLKSENSPHRVSSRLSCPERRWPTITGIGPFSKPVLWSQGPDMRHLTSERLMDTSLTWDDLSQWGIRSEYHAKDACLKSTGRSPQFLEALWQHVKDRVPCPYERRTTCGLSPMDAFRFCVVKILAFIKNGGAIQQAPTTLQVRI